MVQLPTLYPILSAAGFPNPQALSAAAKELAAAGCTLLQYRNKSGNARAMLEQAIELRRFFPARPDSRVSHDQQGAGHPSVAHLLVPQPAPGAIRLIMNDRADLCLAADFDGVHVGQDDLSPEAVRKMIGAERWLGVSTHNAEQLREADLTSADYLAIGPVFATSSKDKPDPVVGLDGVRRARALTRKPLVAIGGITRANAVSVIEAGADSIAVISDLVAAPGKSAEEFFRILR
jgi:thiamine-phosphate pyrophosphorylase